jgi:hypothetical protein
LLVAVLSKGRHANDAVRSWGFVAGGIREALFVGAGRRGANQTRGHPRNEPVLGVEVVGVAVLRSLNEEDNGKA